MEHVTKELTTQYIIKEFNVIRLWCKPSHFSFVLHRCDITGGCTIYCNEPICSPLDYTVHIILYVLMYILLLQNDFS